MASPKFPRHFETPLIPLSLPQFWAVRSILLTVLRWLLLKGRIEIAHLRSVVSRLHREVEHYQSTLDFYQGEAEHAKEA
ncbi:hypothetical protein AMTR_s00113p00035660 [Amborella trichopoda]|uniref:Uncharacterized protein n=1 Tax=Amborella trichopoda TaxID=13333 RepID=W1NV23_AMBTC|nr:hypothetical protein AMTR_s00113p00035660 [Amborella trichopoda]